MKTVTDVVEESAQHTHIAIYSGGSKHARTATLMQPRLAELRAGKLMHLRTAILTSYYGNAGNARHQAAKPPPSTAPSRWEADKQTEQTKTFRNQGVDCSSVCCKENRTHKGAERHGACQSRRAEERNKFVYTKAQSRVIGQEQLCPKIMKKVK